MIENLGGKTEEQERGLRRGDAAYRRYISLAALTVIIAATNALAQTVPMQASDAQVNDDGDLQYCLTNAASQPATAWSVSVLVTDLNGSVVRHSAITTDEYRAEAQLGTRTDEELRASLLRPHRPRRFVVAGPFDERLLLTVTPLAMVFIDGSSTGQAAIIESVFHRRMVERDARHDILQQLRDVQAHYNGLEALKEAIARLSRPAIDDPGNTHLTIQQNLRESLQQAESRSIEPGDALAEEIDLVRREYDAAVQHSVPRKEN